VCFTVSISCHAAQCSAREASRRQHDCECACGVTLGALRRGGDCLHQLSRLRRTGTERDPTPRTVRVPQETGQLAVVTDVSVTQIQQSSRLEF